MKLGVAGLGLIGGSLALAFRDRHEVRGFDVDRATRVAATERGIATVDAVESLVPADAVVVATPLSAVLPTLAALAPRAAGTVLLDVSSVRAPIDAFARDGAEGARLVGMHPMAGRSASGFASADASLFSGRPFLVVPTATTDTDAMRVAGELARDAGGVVTVCSAVEHDRVLAVTSALPLAIAAALALAATEATPRVAAFAGPGLRDATRLAATPGDLAESLLLANGGNVVAAFARVRTLLDELEAAVASRDIPALRALLERAASARAELD